MKSFMGRMRQLEVIESNVLRLFIFIMGCIIGFFSGIYSENAKLEREFGQMKVELSAMPESEEIRGAKVEKFNEGALMSIFTASKGELVGINTYVFESPRIIELWPGTSQKKSEMSSDFARIEFSDAKMSEVKGSSWWGNLKRRHWKAKDEGKPIRTDVSGVGLGPLHNR